MNTITLNLTSADLDRLHRFHIPDDLIECHEIRRVSDTEARQLGITYKGDLSGVAFPVFGADGQIKGYRVRRDNPEVEKGKPKAKYVQSLERPHLYFERSSRRFLSDVSAPVIFVEAYTSALAIAALCKRVGREILIVATAGCWAWKGTIGKTENEHGTRVDEKGPSPDLDHIALRERKTIIMFDSNVESNWKVQAAERTFQRVLEGRGAIVNLARIPREDGVNGPDDFIARHSDEEFLKILDGAEPQVWPEPQPIRAALRPVPALPAALIPDPYRDWLVDISDRMGCPLDFVAVASMVVTASVIGAGCGIRPKQKDDWIVVPNLWGGVIGRPSIMLKSPALQEAMRPLERLAAESKQAYESAQKDHEAEMEMFKARKDAARELMRAAAKGKKKGNSQVDASYAKAEFSSVVEPVAPQWRRYKTNDATIEKLAELLANNDRGLLVFRDEIIGLLSQWDREGREGDRAFFLEAWNGTGSHEVDRIGRGSIRIENACVSILGGIQPAKLTNYLYGAMRGNENDGLVQRLQMMVYPDELTATSCVDRCPDNEAKNRAYSIIKKIAEMDFSQHGAIVPEGGGIPFYRFDDAAQHLFYTWFEDLNRKLREEDEPIITEHLGKFRKLMPSLALIFHIIEVANGDASGSIPERTAKRAMAWCDYLEAHARRIYALVTDIETQAAARLAKRIQSAELKNRFTARDVYRRQWSLLDDKDVVERACEYLVDLGWLRPEEPIYSGGRPRGVEYVINPRLTFVSSVSATPTHLEDEI